MKPTQLVKMNACMMTACGKSAQHQCSMSRIAPAACLEEPLHSINAACLEQPLHIIWQLSIAYTYASRLSGFAAPQNTLMSPCRRVLTPDSVSMACHVCVCVYIDLTCKGMQTKEDGNISSKVIFQ